MERLDEFMARANATYYATHDPFSDFTTSPEISQAFGEILGLWAAVAWQLIGRPDPVMLVECGPGRGTLMTDALRAVAQVAPAFSSALRVHLIETSPRLRAIQTEKLAGAVWHEQIEALPDEPMLLLANEFLDALPIRQFVRKDSGWTERFVVDGRFVERHPTASPPLAGGAWGEGAVLEVNEPALALARNLGCRFSTTPGAALFLDYGPERSSVGDSLQAIRDGQPTDPLSNAGKADMTAHVDFANFAQAARDAGASVHGPIAQGIFLARLGLFQRTDRLALFRPPAQAAALIEAAHRLAEPNRMGRLFKVLTLCHPDCPTPPGFEAEP